MNALVVYDSQYGNTERIARSIGDAMRRFGQVQVIRVGEESLDLTGVDALVIGCPTQGWRPTQAMQTLLQTLTPGRTKGIAIACFDTRFKKPRWLTGSAASNMARKLSDAGMTVATPPESFFVAGTEGPLLTGETERAATWASAFAGAVPRRPVAQR